MKEQREALAFLTHYTLMFSRPKFRASYPNYVQIPSHPPPWQRQVNHRLCLFALLRQDATMTLRKKNAFAYAEEAGGNLYSSVALIVVNDMTVEPKYFFYVRFYLLVSIS